MDISIHDLLKLTSFLNKFGAIKRTIYHPETKEKENDIEHSYHLTLLAWYIISKDKLSLDLHKILTYGLIHDIVEVYAGDTFLYSKDAALLDSKVKREHDAFLQIQKEFPEFSSLTSAIESYEKREDQESRFIHALDKLQPVLQIYLDQGAIWRDEKITLKMLLDKKDEKLTDEPHLRPYWEELRSILIKDEEELFGKIK